MEIFLRLLQFIIKLVYVLVYPVLNWLLPQPKTQQEKPITLPPIKNKLVILPLSDVINGIRQRKFKSVDVVTAYIARIEEVNPVINAVVEDRFSEALKEAQHADDVISRTSKEQLSNLFTMHPFLGVPFTVKESCGVKGMSHVVGSLQRVGMRSADNGKVVALLRAAGAIPLLVSANPEYCFSIETNTHTGGKCLNAYDSRRTCGGSSGGEGALNGAGATLFGVGSDIAGSIRLPSLFNGIFGHKPTGGITSVQGLFPDSDDPNYNEYLQVGPMTRYGRDLSFLMQVMAGPNAHKLDLLTSVETKSIKIFYSLGYDGLNGFLHHSCIDDMKLAIMKAVKHFKQMGLSTQHTHIEYFRNSTEIALTPIVRLQNFPYLINTPNPNKVSGTVSEYVKSIFGRSNHTKDGLVFELLRRTNAFMPRKSTEKYKPEAKLLKEELIRLLGSDGVLFFPTFPVPAIHHNSSLLPLWSIDYTLIFNVLGLPVTHVPMGLAAGSGLPVGFQVIAAPFKDRLCFKIATELEAAFGGWTTPIPHQLN